MAKTASLHPEPPDRFALKSTYDPALVALIKNMPADQRAWHAARRVWLIHVSRHSYVLAVLQQLHYQVTDHVEAAQVEQQAPPGIWLLAGHPDVGQMQAQCPVCWNCEHVCYHAAYADASGATHLQFYSSACGHMWELCLQSAFGRLASWTEVVEAAHDDDVDPDDTETPAPRQAGIAAHVLHGALEAHRQRLQTFDFDAWLEQAMDDEDEDGS